MLSSRPPRAAKESASQRIKESLPAPEEQETDSDAGSFTEEAPTTNSQDRAGDGDQGIHSSKARKRQRRRDGSLDGSGSHGSDVDTALVTTPATGASKAKRIKPKAKRSKISSEKVPKVKGDEPLFKVQIPLVSLVNSLMSKEELAARSLALTVLEPQKDDETYRWPVRESLLLSVPKSQFMDSREQANYFEEQGLGFVDELTGVPKTDEDYSLTETTNDDDDEEELGASSADEHNQEQLLHQRRMTKKERQRRQRLRHADERAANDRLEEVQQYFKEEMTTFAQNQYRKGSKCRVDDLEAFEAKTLPEYRRRAVRSAIGTSKAGDEQEDELTLIQEKAVTFAAEDTLRHTLDRLPYVIRQGALGDVPHYVRFGLPKPVSSDANYERGWDTVMAAASLAGVDDRILKKVSLRMKSLLCQSKRSRYFEPMGKDTVTTMDSTVHRVDPKPMWAEPEQDEMIPEEIKTRLDQTRRLPTTKETFDGLPTPYFQSREFADPLDPLHSFEGRIENARQRGRWTLGPTLGRASYVGGSKNKPSRREIWAEKKRLAKETGAEVGGAEDREEGMEDTGEDSRRGSGDEDEAASESESE